MDGESPQFRFHDGKVYFVGVPIKSFEEANLIAQKLVRVGQRVMIMGFDVPQKEERKRDSGASKLFWIYTFAVMSFGFSMGLIAGLIYCIIAR